MKKVSALFWKFFTILVIGTIFMSAGIIWFYYLTVSLFLPDKMAHEYMVNLLIILSAFELVFVLSISLIFFQLLQRYVDQRLNTQNFFELLLEIISHKFGNFITGQKVNIALMDLHVKSDPIVRRMRKSVTLMEKELSEILSNLATIKKDTLSPDFSLDLSAIIEREKERKECLPTGRTRIRILANTVRGYKLKKAEYAFLVSLLIQNAFKYAHKNVTIRTGRFKDREYIFISNDIAEKRPAGCGTGLSIVSHICAKNSCTLKLSNDGERFKAVVVFPRSRRTCRTYAESISFLHRFFSYAASLKTLLCSG